MVSWPAWNRPWAAHAAGHTLLHTDLRADNLLLAVSIAAYGGPPPHQVLALSPAARAATDDAITATVCAAAGYYTERALRPPPPGIPAARAHQAAQGRAARQWLAELLG